MDIVKSDTMIDIFFVCGLDYDIGLDPYDIFDDSDNCQMLNCVPPIRRPYKPSILQKFPEHRHSLSQQEDYSITSLCMPDGLRLFTPLTVNKDPVNHNFIIIQENSNRIYGTALLFAEEIENSDIKNAVSALQNMYRMGHQTADGRPSCCDDCINTTVDNLNGTTRSSGSFASITTEFWQQDERLYTLKAIGVLSQHAFIQCHQSWLYDIWLMTSNKNRHLKVPPIVESSTNTDLYLNDLTLGIDLGLNIENYIYNMLFEVTVPDRGRSVAIDGPSMRHYCQLPDLNELPVFELPIRGLLEVLGLENFIRAYSCVLLEYRVVIISQDYRLLMLVAESITTLLFPFVWSYVYAPILPLAARHYLCAPVPFIMGIKLNNNENEESIQLASDSSVCYVNVDRQTVTSSDDIPSFPYELDLRREITEILVRTISSEVKSTKVSQTQGQCVKENDDVFIGTNNINNLCNSTSDLPTVKPYLLESILGRKSSNSLSSVNPSRLSTEAGISVHELMMEVEENSLKSEIMAKKYSNLLKSNKVFRDLFFNHFLHIFYAYEQFIIMPKLDSDRSNYAPERVSLVQDFDKAGFLSEQPETHLPFLSAFLETQMFASFIDMKILSAWYPAHPNLILFERGLRKMQYNIKNQLSSSPYSDINFKPYFKTDELIESTARQYEQSLCVMRDKEPDIYVHEIPCNGFADQECYAKKLKPVCEKNDNNSLGTSFPVLQSHFFVTKPPQKSSTKSPEYKVRSISEDAQENVEESHSDERCDKDESVKKIKTQSRTLDYRDKSGANKQANRRLESLPYIPNIAPFMAQDHKQFVNILLQECQAKTKRMVLEKMGGQQAVELGHSDRFVSGIEENTLVAYLCDLLERIWCHGRNGSHGKSALWTHLTMFVERDKEKCIIKPTKEDKARQISILDKKETTNERVKEALAAIGVDSYCLYRYFNDSKGENHCSDTYAYLRKMQVASECCEKSRNSTPDFINKVFGSPDQNLSTPFVSWNPYIPGKSGDNSILRSSSGDSKSLDPMTLFERKERSVVADVKAIKLMTDIKTDVSLSRAFVRLSLEKKSLSANLEELLSDSVLLRELYKRHSFLRCDKEREQFLFHLLALQAMEYYSFTNLYINCHILYRVYIYSGKRFSTGKSTTAKAWFCVNGQHCSTGDKSIPKSAGTFEFENQNLGMLTTMTIGHDNAGLSPSWYIEFVLIQNLVTDHVYRFPSYHWLSKTIDDGSTELLLIGELIRLHDGAISKDENDVTDEMLEHQTTSRSLSVSNGQNDAKIVSDVPDIQEQLGNAVNNLVKYFCRQQDREKITINSINGSCNVTLLLCGEGGLVRSLERVFMHGFRSNRIFKKKFFLWDYLEKVAMELEHDLLCQGRSMTASAENVHCNTELKATRLSNRVALIEKMCKLVEKITLANQLIGKDGKFQRFVCLCIRDRILPELIELFAIVDCTQHFYEVASFFRNVLLKEFLIKILSALSEFIIPLEAALTHNL